MAVTIQSSYMSNNLEKIYEDDDLNDNIENEFPEKETFFQRLKKDWIIIKNNIKHRPVYRYYLFFIFSGMKPKFEGMNYIMMKEVYKISQVEIGALILLAAILLFFSIILFQVYLKNYEMRTLTWYGVTLMVCVSIIELFQVFRFNIQWGISDF